MLKDPLKFTKSIRNRGQACLMAALSLYGERMPSRRDALIFAEGLLQQRLQSQNYSRFVGTDISDLAIQKAAADAGDDKSTYLVADMDTYKPEGRFDLIIFNEVIYYSKHPLKTLQRLATYLKPDGLLIVTINDHKHSAELWEVIKDGFPLLDEATTINSKGKCVCKVLSSGQ
jgi:2-polyprenyl-6-hydroxyphenyl methylase/3-demethylubiquinone-9 3-methyltransferase